MAPAEQLAARREALLGVVPYAALRRLNEQQLFELFVAERVRAYGRRPTEQIWETSAAGSPVRFYYEQLTWDSAFFQQPMVRLHTVLFTPGGSVELLATALREFTQLLARNEIRHCYCEVAAADTELLVAGGRAGWSTVETRLHYLYNSPELPAGPESAVRAASEPEAEQLRRIAAANTNPHDRFHADPFFGPDRADAFLGEYAAAAARGYCDAVLVPAREPVDSFLAISYLAADAALLGTKLGRVVLTAVGPQNRGWHRRLLTETVRHCYGRGAEAVLMSTQAANQAVIHNAQQVGFRLGGVTHLLSCQPG
ncbi:hypothetical protein LJY25_15875 [Hymenobacter sp. BT175]|uniref:hypothetical protein n=1 Tax=Hymenobacter translucens TaxID=2886507 RepID=UPI001D0E679C|nr:hypothetical protein [Hymenobacter translucens]MCC2547928.1 hypothetical protein [Hymenobacter translucens]